MAEELTRAGLNVVAIERGAWRDTSTDFPQRLTRTSYAGQGSFVALASFTLYDLAIISSSGFSAGVELDGNNVTKAASLRHDFD